jgi:hypothetical protein
MFSGVSKVRMEAGVFLPPALFGRAVALLGRGLLESLRELIAFSRFWSFSGAATA